jgi:hypothetical protein
MLALIFAYYFELSTLDSQNILSKRIFGIASDIILAIMLIFIWKYFAVDPVDKGLLMNE